MARVLFFTLLFIVSCGRPNPETTKSSKDQKFLNPNQKIEANSLQLEKFQVNVRQFAFVRDRVFNIELIRLNLEQYYLQLALSNFLYKQLNYVESFRFNPEDLAQNEVYKINRNKQYQYFQELNIAHINDDQSEVIESLLVDFDIDLKDELISKLAGIEVNLWDQYQNKSFQIGYVSKEKLKRSEFYEDNYIVRFENNINLGLLKEFVNKELTLRFRLRFKENTSQKVLFYYHSKNTRELLEFHSIQRLKTFLNESELTFSEHEKIIHNLSELPLNKSFYYFIESTRKMIENDFPYLRSRKTNLEYESEITFDSDATRIQVIADMIKETFNIKKKKKKLHTYVLRMVLPKINNIRKIKHHCKVYFWKNLGLIQKPFPEKVFSADDFKLFPEEISLYQKDARLFLAISNPRELEKLKLISPIELQQEYPYGYAGGLKKCATSPLEKVIARHPEQISKSMLTKIDTLKLKGEVITYFIPWNEIEYSSNLEKD